MNCRALGLPSCSLVLSLLLLGVLPSCGGDDTPPPADVDAGDADAGPRDAGPRDAAPLDAAPVDAGDVDAGECLDDDRDGHGAAWCGDDCDDADPTRYPGVTEVCDLDDEDCNDATFGTDADGDGFESNACCNGTGNCGPDCDDTDSNVHPGATEVCDGFDNNCNLGVDEGVCVLCGAGYTGFDGACTDVDECLMATTCGGGRASCTNNDGSYACGCQTGYAAPTAGGTCVDVDECDLGLCGTGMATCVNSVGGYECTCNAGFAVAGPGAPCVDVDECLIATTCGGERASCTNNDGSYACSCQTGYSAPVVGGMCFDVDECAMGTPCGVGLGSCVNSAGSYECTCNSGYAAPATGGTCTDLDECMLGTDDCDRDPAATCANTVGAHACMCPAGFTSPAGDARGAGGCLLSDPSLSSLVPSTGGLSPAFAGGTTTYMLALPPGTTSVALTPSAAHPMRTTITVDGVTAASGAASAPISLPLGLAPRPVLVTVTTETGATRTYTVVVSRSPAYVKASNTGAHDYFGYSVSLSADGTRLAVGADWEASSATGVGGNQADDSAYQSGAVYVFSRTGTTWAQEAYIKASNTGIMDHFGTCVSLSSDGTRLAVGARFEDSNATGVGGNQADNSAGASGAAYVFSRTGTTWSQEAYVKASNTATSDYFGTSVSLSSNGTRLAVGAYFEASSATGVGGDETNNIARESGAVYVFLRSGTTWTQEAYVKASNTDQEDYFGWSVSLSADGTRLAVGAYREASSATGVNGDQADNTAAESGAVYVFSRTGTMWTQEAYVKASNTGAFDQFGWSVSLSSDGTRLAVGAFNEASSATGVGGNQADNSAGTSGAAYVFSRTGTTWSQEAYVKASNTETSDYFGTSVSLSLDGTRLAVGAHFEASSATGIGGNQADNSQYQSGAVYMFSRTGMAWVQEAYVKASNTGTEDQFGWSVSLSSDGTRFAVGAVNEASSATGVGGNQANNSAARSGAVYVY